ncbi:hypothetical protein AAZX31_10G092300 [Glycine max]
MSLIIENSVETMDKVFWDGIMENEAGFASYFSNDMGGQL